MTAVETELPTSDADRSRGAPPRHPPATSTPISPIWHARLARRPPRPRAAALLCATGSPADLPARVPRPARRTTVASPSPVSWASSPCATTRSSSSTSRRRPRAPAWPTSCCAHGEGSIAAALPPGLAGGRRRQRPGPALLRPPRLADAGAFDYPAPTARGHDHRPYPRPVREAAGGECATATTTTMIDAKEAEARAGRPAPRTDDGNQATGGQGRAGRRRHPGRRAGHRRRSSARPAPPSTAPGAPRGRSARRWTGPRPSRRPPRSSTRPAGTGIAVQVDHLVPEQVAALVDRIERRAGRAARARQRHLGRHHHGVGQDGVGVVARHRAAHAAPGHRHPRHHQPLRPAAADPPPGRARRRGDRRDRRVQRHQLPGVVLLRPGQGGQPAHGVRPRPRAGAPRRDGRRAHAGLAALGGDARGASGSPRPTGATPPSACRTSPSPRARRSSAGRSPRWPPTPTWPAGTASRCRAGSWRQVYGFTDLDGSQPDAWRYVPEVQDAGKPADTTGYR